MPPIWHLTLFENRFLTGHISDAPPEATLCFSMIAPVALKSEGHILRAVGGYTEILADFTTDFTLTFQDDAFEVFNIGWLPQGAYLRLKNGTCIDVEIGFDTPAHSPAPHEPQAKSPALRLVPQPTNWRPDGGTLNAKSGFSIGKNPFPDALISAAKLADRTHLGPLLGGPVPLDIQEDSRLEPEAYTLVITPKNITITAATSTGAFYAAVTLINLQATYQAEIPTGKMADSPRFEWRGQQLDCARHFYQPETLFKLLDLMALFKLNRFHWHFSDDEAFRLEVKSFPEIWQKTAMRGEGCLIPGVFGGGQGPTGGSYSLDFACALVARASELKIETLPEVEIPAHAYALNLVFPALMDTGDNSLAPSVQGYIDNTMNPAQPFTWTLTKALIQEICEIFPFKHIHLGCDERPPKAWLNSPKAQAFMAENALKNADDLQEWIIAKAARFAKECGAQPCAWEEAIKGKNGGIGNDAILFSWTGQGPGLEAARRGYKVVMTPAQHLYFDHTHSTEFAESGARWAGYLPLEKTVSWQPVPPDEPELETNIIGVEGAFWSEFTHADSKLEPKLAPRILGLAEVAWRAKATPANKASIAQAARAYEPVFDKIGWRTFEPEPK
ncbi:MAG: family 20 glycosylhydrolase [Rhodobacteraceae bacterium]|nr:family 20 glycosylhydrolase [Paracoccaceae bacterium]